jgi:hypothetical protein
MGSPQIEHSRGILSRLQDRWPNAVSIVFGRIPVLACVVTAAYTLISFILTALFLKRLVVSFCHCMSCRPYSMLPRPQPLPPPPLMMTPFPQAWEEYGDGLGRRSPLRRRNGLVRGHHDNERVALLVRAVVCESVTYSRCAGSVGIREGEIAHRLLGSEQAVVLLWFRICMPVGCDETGHRTENLEGTARIGHQLVTAVVRPLYCDDLRQV